jgi:hypothetical protein
MALDLCTMLTESIPDVVAHWEELVDREPWSALSPADRLDELPAFLRALFDWTICAPSGERAPTTFLNTAAAHGAQRRRCGLGYDHVMEESALLRRAVWDLARPHHEHFHAMVRIDSALTVALLASLRGYSKQELVARGEWETTLARLVSDWTALLRD